jgi:hypothetical protein
MGRPGDGFAGKSRDQEEKQEGETRIRCDRGSSKVLRRRGLDESLHFPESFDKDLNTDPKAT